MLFCSLSLEKKEKNICSDICSLCALNQRVMCFKYLNEQSLKEFWKKITPKKAKNSRMMLLF